MSESENPNISIFPQDKVKEHLLDKSLPVSTFSSSFILTFTSQTGTLKTSRQ